jgi:hypothetical protein
MRLEPDRDNQLVHEAYCYVDATLEQATSSNFQR